MDIQKYITVISIINHTQLEFMVRNIFVAVKFSYLISYCFT